MHDPKLVQMAANWPKAMSLYRSQYGKVHNESRDLR